MVAASAASADFSRYSKPPPLGGGAFTSKEVFMSACTVWELILAVAAIVATVFAYRYKSLANRMKTRARIYIKYVPSGELTGEERVIFEDLKKDLLTVRSFWKLISKIWKFIFEEHRTSNAVSISLRTTARLTDKRP
jgi:hypothetical protein